MRWAGRVAARKEEFRNTHRVLVEKPEGTRPLGRPMGSWEDTITIIIGVGWVVLLRTGMTLLKIWINIGLT